jgi:putative oxidoreductase
MCLHKAVAKIGDPLYFVFRLIVGFFIMFHGLGKFMPGFIGPGSLEKMAGMLFNQVWLAGLVATAEVAVGICLILGLFVRPAAVLGAVVVLGALVLVHLPMSLNPVTNNSELAFMYLGAFIVLFIHGARKWGLEQVMLKKEWLW